VWRLKAASDRKNAWSELRRSLRVPTRWGNPIEWNLLCSQDLRGLLTNRFD
jgi:hypothetical protein